MNVLFAILLAGFAFGAGLLLGTGNRKGIRGAIIPGIIFGLAIALPAIHEAAWQTAMTMAAATFVGVFACAFLKDGNRIKSFMRSQRNLYIHCGSYQLGTKPDND